MPTLNTSPAGDSEIISSKGSTPSVDPLDEASIFSEIPETGPGEAPSTLYTAKNGIVLPETQIADLVTRVKGLNLIRNIASAEDCGIYGEVDLITRIDKGPPSTDVNKLFARLGSTEGIMPIFKDTENGEHYIGIRACKGEQPVPRQVGNLDFYLEENLLRFVPEGNLDKFHFIVLQPGDYDTISKNNLTTDPEKRARMLDQYQTTDKGMLIRDTIISKAIKMGASDIHIEAVTNPGKEPFYRVRCRVHGELKVIEENLPEDRGRSLITAVKVKAKIDITERRKPGGGKISFDAEDILRYPKFEGFSCRVSTIAAEGGETAVIRLLKPPSTDSLNLAKIGLPNSIYLETKAMIGTSGKIILNTGPTGSGKSTTFYAIVNELKSDDVKIITIEDPIESVIPGITQIQVDEKIGNTFSEILRTVLRQDPDVILIGEIRDAETAKVAVQAANSGHLVLATLHTTSAVLTIARLYELGIEGTRIAENVQGIFSQRLVRTCCPSCVPFFDASESINKLLALGDYSKNLPSTEQFENLDPIGMPLLLRKTSKTEDRSKNCGKCQDTGWIGRHPIVELWRPDENDIDMISSGERRASKFLDAALSRPVPYKPLAVRAFTSALRGETTIEEVIANVLTSPQELLHHRRFLRDLCVERALLQEKARRDRAAAKAASIQAKNK